MRTINNVKTLLVLAMTLTMANAASAQKEAPPQGSAPKPFTLPAHETYSLSNGMKVTLVPYGNIPKVTVSAVISAGNLNEPAELPGLADLMGHLMKEGTKTRSSQKVAEESADMGGSLDVSVGADESAIETDVLSEFAPK
ncbi:MAG TPA: insulinase family protein, partial [Candidatus Acidoferrum sp.]|nr:insulinase family protein [Candidatus Acidoferrum sp.]